MSHTIADAAPPAPAVPEPRHGHARRIRFLDALRGLAILLVIGYHAFSRHPQLMPFRDRYAHVPLFEYGWLGVELFFLISGFVIFMTLEKCRGFFDFMTRRWLRLFPAMLVCSLVIVLVFTLLLPGSSKNVSLAGMLPGLSFIEPDAWGMLLGAPPPLLEGSFWSLFVEVKFYAIAGGLFFLFGEAAAIRGIVLLFLAVLLQQPLRLAFPNADLHWLAVLHLWTGAGYFGWFAAGALYFRFFQTRTRRLFLLATAIGLLAALGTGGGARGVTACALMILALFAAVVRVERLHALLENRLLLFIGFISYPLYLVHESIMVQLTVLLGKAFPAIPVILMPMLPLLAVICIATVIAAHVEPWLASAIRPLYRHARRQLRIDREAPIPVAGAAAVNDILPPPPDTTISP